ncbi:MAG: M20/M25/M40 family metallo-hydrolase [Methylococcaceae bacterium]|nr:M20/M25/M40 family metallo-hydrolase [Methylococcaceae bacterium]
MLGLIVLVVIGINHTYPTKPPSLAASLSSFSSTRAMSHVWKIASKPHPTGTYDNEVVRNYIVGELFKLGLKPEVQSTFVVNPQKQYAGRVYNIIVRLPGQHSGKALLLSAHYDSVHTGPGAADDGASVAAILETFRALKTNKPLQNEVIGLFTDSEESGLLGAEAFVNEHPLAKEIGLVLNFEYRGNRGAFMMFETSQGNGKLVQGLACAVPFVMANSLMYEVYKRLPNDTDFTVFKKAGIPGMNFAAIEGLTAYHTQLDRPDLLDQGTLQQEGEIMLNLVGYFGDASLSDLKAADRVYFDLPGLGIMHYPASWSVKLALLLLLFFVSILACACMKQIAGLKAVLTVGALFPIICLVLALSGHGLWHAVLKFHPEYLTFVQGDTYNSLWYLLAFVMINIGLFRIIQAWVSRWFQLFEIVLGVMTFLMLLNLLSAIGLPGASFVLFWPLASLAVAIGIIIFTGNNNYRSFAALVPVFLGGIPGVIIFTILIKSIYVALTAHMISVVMVCLAIVLGLLTLLMEIAGYYRVLVGLCFLAGFSALVAGSATSSFDSSRPRQQSLFYVFDNQSQQAFWLSSDTQPDPWTASFFNKVTEMQALPVLYSDRPSIGWMSVAPVFSSAVPKMSLQEDIVKVNGRHVKIRIETSKHAVKQKIVLDGADVLYSKINGQRYTDSRQSTWAINAVGLRDEELVIEFLVEPEKTFTVKVKETAYGFENIINSMPSYLINSPVVQNNTRSIISVLKFDKH